MVTAYEKQGYEPDFLDFFVFGELGKCRLNCRIAFDCTYMISTVSISGDTKHIVELAIGGCARQKITVTHIYDSFVFVTWLVKEYSCDSLAVIGCV